MFSILCYVSISLANKGKCNSSWRRDNILLRCSGSGIRWEIELAMGSAARCAKMKVNRARWRRECA